MAKESVIPEIGRYRQEGQKFNIIISSTANSRSDLGNIKTLLKDSHDYSRYRR